MLVCPIGINGTLGTIDAAVVTKCSLLLSNKTIKQLGMAMDWAEDRITVHAANAYNWATEFSQRALLAHDRLQHAPQGPRRVHLVVIG